MGKMIHLELYMKLKLWPYEKVVYEHTRIHPGELEFSGILSYKQIT